MAGTCSVCGQWLDDIESSAVPQDRCWEHKQSPEEVEGHV